MKGDTKVVKISTSMKKYFYDPSEVEAEDGSVAQNKLFISDECIAWYIDLTCNDLPSVYSVTPSDVLVDVISYSLTQIISLCS